MGTITIVKIILVGIGATIMIDIWGYFLSLFKIKSLDYKFVGRWIGHMPEGKFFHQTILDAPPVKNEKIIGWTAHFLIGLSFAFLLIILFGAEWLSHPTLLPPIIIGLCTAIAPLFIMQPAFGFGIASSKLPGANLRRVKSLMTHLVYGLGLFISAICVNLFL